MTWPLYTCIIAETLGFKLFRTKHQTGHEAYVVAKPHAKFDFSMKLEDTTPAIVKVTKAFDDKSFVNFAFCPSDNIQWLKLETIKMFEYVRSQLQDTARLQTSRSSSSSARLQTSRSSSSSARAGIARLCMFLRTFEDTLIGEDCEDDDRPIQAGTSSKPSKASKDEKGQKKKVIKWPSAAKWSAVRLRIGMSTLGSCSSMQQLLLSFDLVLIWSYMGWRR